MWTVLGDPNSGQGSTQSALSEFLRYCRESRRPEDFHLQGGTRRRVRGLRREEVAVLSNISSTWYTQLEQGRLGRHPTADVLDAIAHGLNLSPDEHDHLRSLGGYPPTKRRPDEITASPQIKLLVEKFPFPASAATPWFDYLAWNRLFVSFVGVDPADVPVHQRNPLYVWLKMEKSREGMQGWEPAKEAVVARLRYEIAEYGEHPRFKELVEDLCAMSEPFRTVWEQHQVRRSMDVGRLVIDHPVVGSVAIHPVRLTVQDNPLLRLGIYLPATGADEAKFRELDELANAGTR